MSNANVVKEFVKQVSNQKPEIASDSYTLGYLMSFVENNMTPAMKKKMEKHTAFLKELKTA